MDKNLTSATEATKYEWLDEAGLKKIITALLKVVNGNIKTSAYDDTAIKALIKENTDAINTINGTGDGSISKAVADGILCAQKSWRVIWRAKTEGFNC